MLHVDDQRLAASGGTGKRVADADVVDELALVQAGLAVLDEAVDADDVAVRAREYQNWVTAGDNNSFVESCVFFKFCFCVPYVHACEALDLFEVGLDEVQGRAAVVFAPGWVVGALEVELGPSIVAEFHLACAAHFLWLQHIFPAARVTVNCEGSGFAQTAADAQLAAL